MRKLIYWVHTPVDGFIDGPNGEFDWPQMGPELSAYGDQVHAGVDTFVYGRAVWDMMSSYWPQAESISTDPHDLKFARSGAVPRRSCSRRPSPGRTGTPGSSRVTWPRRWPR